MKITRAVVPSLFTTLNIFCGFLAMVNASQDRIEMAAWFIILAGVFDSLDGVMARITRSSSQFGVELDSLADVVSFGAAPSYIVWKVHLSTIDNWGVLIAAFPLVFGAIRLARFNVQLSGFDKTHFKGLPIPMQAITICAFLLQYHSAEYGLTGWPKDALAPITAVLGLLMVSRIKYDTFPKFSRKDFLANPWRIVGMGVGVLLVVFSKGQLFFAVISAFVVQGVIRSAIQWMRKPSEVDSETDTEEDPETSNIEV